MKAALTGVRVLDFSHALAGPYCTFLLSSYGAEVLKVESPDGGDIGRTWAPPFVGDQSAYFLGLNAGKRGLSINLKHPRGKELCLDLIGKCDVLIENFRPGTMDRLGLGYEEARQRNSRLIYCSISGYGQYGPSRDEPAMDLILQASSGLISMTGEPDGARVRCGHSVADITAGLFAVIGILLALQSGEGQLVDVSMFDSMISAMSSNFANFFATGISPEPMGTAFGTIVPYRTFATSDGEVAIAVGSERLWRAFCEVIDRADLYAHPDYATNSLRVGNRDTLEPMLAEIFRGGSSEQWRRRLELLGIPCTPVRTLDQVAEDPHAAARRMFIEVDHPTAGKQKVTGAPVKLSQAPSRSPAAAPLLGADTSEALRELLRLDETELDRLIREGVIVQAPATATSPA